MARSAPARNQNAAGSGLYSKQPGVRLIVPADVGLPLLADFARNLAGAGMTIAEGVLTWLETPQKIGEKVPDAAAFHAAHEMVGLYAAVAQELQQLGAELDGVTGIKAAPLGDLSQARFEALMREEARALGLVLSQCATASKRLADREHVLGIGHGLIHDGEINPALRYLAGHMRTAKRMMRDMAANLAWKQGTTQDGGDLGDRLIRMIEGEDADDE